MLACDWSSDVCASDLCCAPAALFSVAIEVNLPSARLSRSSHDSSAVSRSPSFLALPLANGSAEFFDDFLRRLDGGGVLVHVERDGADARVPASAVALADAGEVDLWVLRSPGIRSDGNFHAETAFAETDAVDRLRMQVIGNELVVALEIVVGDVEEDRRVLALRALLEDSNRKLVALEKLRQ